MNIVTYPAAERGTADYGWLKANYSFSFANWYNPERMHFGVLRVLNDDEIAAHSGFSEHQHDNMEIITLVLEGVLSHADNMGNGADILPDHIQVMSAGKGIQHAEINSGHTPVKLLQIWVFPHTRNVEPRYEQLYTPAEERLNQWQQIIKPIDVLTENGIGIYQNARFYLASIQDRKTLTYKVKKPGNGVYLIVLNGSLELHGKTLNTRDAAGIQEAEYIEVSALTECFCLLMEVPMQ